MTRPRFRRALAFGTLAVSCAACAAILGLDEVTDTNRSGDAAPPGSPGSSIVEPDGDAAVDGGGDGGFTLDDVRPVDVATDGGKTLSAPSLSDDELTLAYVNAPESGPFEVVVASRASVDAGFGGSYVVKGAGGISLGAQLSPDGNTLWYSQFFTSDAGPRLQIVRSVRQDGGAFGPGTVVPGTSEYSAGSYTAENGTNRVYLTVDASPSTEVYFATITKGGLTAIDHERDLSTEADHELGLALSPDDLLLFVTRRTAKGNSRERTVAYGRDAGDGGWGLLRKVYELGGTGDDIRVGTITSSGRFYFSKRTYDVEGNVLSSGLYVATLRRN